MAQWSPETGLLAVEHILGEVGLHGFTKHPLADSTPLLESQRQARRQGYEFRIEQRDAQGAVRQRVAGADIDQHALFDVGHGRLVRTLRAGAGAFHRVPQVELVLQAKADVTFPGVVHHVSSKVDTESGTVEVTIRVEDAPQLVRSGSFVGVKMIRTRNATAAWLPREAVILGPRGAHVFVVEDGVAHRREITPGAQERGRLEVVSGLEAGEQVVLTGHGGLEDGERVEPE